MNPILLAPTTLSQSQALEYISIAAAAGYDGIGLRLYPSPHLPFFPVAGNPQAMEEVRKALADTDLFVHDIFTCYLEPDMDFDAMGRAIEYGAVLGASYVLVIGNDPDWGRITDNFGRLCDIAAGHGIVCAVEAPVNSRTLTSLELNVKLIADSGKRAVLSIDPAQFIRAGNTFSQLKALDPSLLPYSQIDDTQNLTPGQPLCMPGDGVVPLPELLDLLPPDAPLSLEYHHRDERFTRQEWAAHVLNGTRAYLQRYHESRA